jgi:cytoplasmic iron level regulating protein YaaA (DUF328/UPF0246 family)
VRALILLPSSETKAPGGSGSWDPATGRRQGDRLAGRRTEVARALAAAVDDAAQAARITGVRGAAHLRAVTADRATIGAPVLPACARYRGVVWDHLDPPGLSRKARALAARSVLVVSALAGVMGWDEPLPDYKVKLSARLDPLGVLSTAWREAVTAELAARAERADLVVDLLPGDHARTVDFNALDTAVVHVTFTTADRRAAGHGAKAAKGRFARHLLETGGDPHHAAATFAWEGWRPADTGLDDCVEITLPAL